MASEHKTEPKSKKPKSEKPNITREVGAEWAVAAFPGTLYETQSTVIQFLSGNVVKNSATAKIATDTFKGAPYTFVVFEPY